MSDEDDIDFFVLKDLLYEVNEINKNEANAADKSLTEEEERKQEERKEGRKEGRKEERKEGRKKGRKEERKEERRYQL